MLKTKVYFYKGKFSDFQNLMESEGYSTESLEDSGIDGLCFDFGGIQAIWISQNASSEVKAHECLHAVLNICSNRGLDRNDDELLCYMLEHLFVSL